MKVEKRDGRIVPFDKSKIHRAIEKAFTSCDQDTDGVTGVVDIVMEAVTSEAKETWPIEELQDIVEDSLMTAGHTDVARSYIKYRQRRHQLRQLRVLLGVTDDLKLGINAATLLNRRYLIKDKEGNVTETPSQLFRRVAKAVAKVETHYDRQANGSEIEDLFYHMMTNLEFIPNSPTLFSAGTELGQLSACFVVPVEDSLDSIFQAVWQMAKIQKSGGGTGFAFSRLRPKDSPVGSTGGVASGPVSFMRIFDTTTDVIRQGGVRRGANMGVLRVDHPDILEFIRCKADKVSYRNFNISIAITDKFMKAYFADEEYELINPHTSKPTEKLSARFVFEQIAHYAWLTGDPGILFIDRINQAHPLKGEEIEATNPCITGDTLIAVADGRDAVPIQRLAEEGRDVPVYSWSGDGVVVRMGRNPRKTRENVPLVKIVFDNGSTLKVTLNHRIMMRDGSYREAGQLVPGDRVMPFNKIQYRNKGKRSKYWHIHQNKHVWHRGEHKLIAEYFLGRELQEGEVVHHKDLDSLNNSWGNLQILSEEEHNRIHTERMEGRNNPYHRMPESWIKTHMAVGRRGEANGMYGRHHTDWTKEIIGRKAKERHQDPAYRERHRQQVIKAMNQPGVRERISVKARERWASSRIQKACPVCAEVVEYVKSHPQVCCSHACANTYRAWKRRGMVEANHRVVEVIPCGTGDVYNITVDDDHNFATVNREYTSKAGNRKLSGVIIANCGEVPLLGHECCVLGSINLSSFVKDGKVDFKHLGEIVELGVRFLDNVIDANKYPFNEIDIKAKAGRKIGLGIMGFAEMLIQLGVAYDSDEGLQWARDIMGFVNERSRKASAKLAKLRGNFELKGQSKIRAKYRRNATVNTIAPTGSIGIIAGTSSGIEPLFGISYVRVLAEGVQLHESNKYFEQLAQEQGFWDEALAKEIAKTGSVQHIDTIPVKMKALFKTAHEISPEQHVRMQAAFQEYVDNAVSKTANLPNSATPEDIKGIYLLAWELGCKGITVFRDGCLDVQVLYKGDTLTCELDDPSCPSCSG